jgi:hypothetical protein
METAVEKTHKIIPVNKQRVIIGTTSVLVFSSLTYAVHYLRNRSKRLAAFAEHYRLNEYGMLYLDEFKSKQTKRITRKMLRYVVAHEPVLVEDLENELRLPLFKENIKHIIKQIQDSKNKGKILLFESPAGCGVRYALQSWSISEHKHNKIILNLDLQDYFSMLYQQDRTVYSGDSEQFIYAILNVFGYFSFDDISNKYVKIGSSSSNSSVSSRCLSEESFSNQTLSERLDEKLVEIETVLKIVKSKSCPVTLVIKNIHLLFNDSESNNSQYDKINEIFAWLLKNEKEGLLEVILCNSGTSLISALRKFKGYSDNLDFKTYELMNPKTVQKYLMEQVNVDLVDKFKFTKETSQEFVKYFSSNFIEIEDYCQSNVTVDKFIGIRRGEQVNKVKKFFKETPGFDPLSALADPYVIPPIEHLKDCILEMMMKDGVLSLDNVLPNVDNHHLSIDEQELKYNLILKLINWNIFKWQSVTKNDKSKMSIFESSKNHLLNLTALTGATIINGVKDSIKMTEEKINEKLSVLNNASTEVSDVKSRDINVDEIKERDVITTNVFDNYNNDTVLPNSNYVKEPINDNHYYNDNNYYYHDYTNSQSITPVNEWKDYIPPTVPVKNDFMTSFGYDNRYSHNEIWESEKNQRELLKIKKKDHPYELTYYNIFIKEHLENWFNSIL